jgi:carbonic anhydrase
LKSRRRGLPIWRIMPAFLMEPDQALKALLEGNRRFRAGQGGGVTYTEESLAELAKRQSPVAAIVACSDSRVAPEIVLDQPLGSVFCCRVPGNVASESARWMADMAVGELGTPLVLVMGHTGCLAVTSVMQGTATALSGFLKLEIRAAIYASRRTVDGDAVRRAVEANAIRARNALAADCPAVARAIRAKACRCEAAIYEMETGLVSLIEPD